MSLPRTRSLGWRESMDGAVLRVLHSRPYVIFSTVLALVSVATLGWSLFSSCPGVAYISIEIAINALVLGEVIVRLYVTNAENIMSSFSSLVDVAALVVCGVSLVVLTMPCSSAEKLSDVVLLIIRNAIQIARLYIVINKNRETMNRMDSRVDFTSLMVSGGINNDDDDDDNVRSQN